MNSLGGEVSGTGLDVGFVCRSWALERGAVEQHSLELARGLAARGHRAHVLCLDERGASAPYATHIEVIDGVDVRHMACGAAAQRALADLVVDARADNVVTAWLAEVPCDVVHVHHLAGFGAGALRAIAALGRPLVVTLHDYWLLCPREQMCSASGELCAQPLASVCGPCLARTWPQLMPSKGGDRRGPDGNPAPTDEQAAARRTHFAVAQLGLAQRRLVPSRAAAEPFVRVGVEERALDVCAHGLDYAHLAREVAASRAAHPRPAGDFVRLGVLGRVQSTSGVLALIEAFAAARVPNLALEIHGELANDHGDASCAARVRERAAATARVTLHGALSRADLPRALAALDGVAAPVTWNEVDNRALREARAAGLPVLVSDRAGSVDLAQGGRAGLVVAAHDREAWSRALERFASDSQARAAWSAAPHELRNIGEMALDVEGHYLAAIRDASGEVRPHAPPQRAKANFLRRWFGG